MLVAGCFSEHASATGPDPGGRAGICRIPVGSSVVGSVQAVIAIRGFAFVPDTIRVLPGTTVTWVNCEEESANEQHNAAAEDGGWSTALLSPTALGSRRFDEPGVHPYLCELHPFMRGVVVVE
jgi:plastocyanin